MRRIGVRERWAGRLILFAQRHRWAFRLAPHRWWGRLVWWTAEQDPAFVEGIREAQSDFEAGRFYSLDRETGKTHPNPDWPKDGPQPTHR